MWRKCSEELGNMFLLSGTIKEEILPTHLEYTEYTDTEYLIPVKYQYRKNDWNHRGID
jgi:hypothetical protein